MTRPQFTLRALLVAMLVVGAFLGGIWFECERQRRANEAALDDQHAALREAFEAVIRSGPYGAHVPTTE